MPKNILILTPFPPEGCGGAETFVKELIKEAKKLHEVTLCTLRPRRKPWRGIGILNLFSVFPILMLKAFFQVLKRRPDIIHAQGLISGLIAVLLKKIFRFKVYITLLALYEFKPANSWRELGIILVANFIFKNCDVIFVEGLNGKKDIEIFRQKDSKIKVFSHWVDQDIFKPASRLKNNTEDDKIRILFVGRPTREKGRHVVEEAERFLNNKERYEFTYVENVSYEDLPKYYQMAHICVVPSLYAEGYSRVVAESASCGCSVITSDMGSLPEMVKEFGYSIKPIPINIATAIETMSKKKWLYKFQEFSIEYSKNNFSPKNAEVFLNEYNI